MCYFSRFRLEKHNIARKKTLLVKLCFPSFYTSRSDRIRIHNTAANKPYIRPLVIILTCGQLHGWKIVFYCRAGIHTQPYSHTWFLSFIHSFIHSILWCCTPPPFPVLILPYEQVERIRFGAEQWNYLYWEKTSTQECGNIRDGNLGDKFTFSFALASD